MTPTKTTRRLAKAYGAAEACNLRGVLRSFLKDAGELWWNDRTGDQDSLLILWADIVLNILNRPDHDRIMEAYWHGREAPERSE